MEVAVLALAGSATALATGLGAVPVFLLGDRAERLRPFLWGTAVGLMGVASIVGLLVPAVDEGGGVSVVAGPVRGAGFLLVSRRLLEAATSTLARSAERACGGRCSSSASCSSTACRRGSPSAPRSRPTPRGSRCSWCSRSVSRTSPRARPWRSRCRARASVRAQQFWAAVLTSAPQPVGAVVAYLAVEHITGLLPFSFAFAAGAMLVAGGRRAGSAGVCCGWAPGRDRGHARGSGADAAAGAHSGRRLKPASRVALTVRS